MAAAFSESAGRQPGRLGAGRKLAVGAGDFGLNIYWQIASLYLLYFYTDVLQIPPATAGAIYMLALVWDAALDPLVGLLADRTRSRSGRYRPYLLIGAPLLAVSFVAMFLLSTWATSWSMSLTVLLHFAFRGLYAVVAVPYASLSARITTDSNERGDIAAFRMIGATAAAVVVAMATLPIAAHFGHGREGWGGVAVLYGALATAMLLLCAFGVTGLDAATADEPSGPTLREKLRTTALNGPLLIVLAGVAVSSMTQTIFQKNLVYYFKYVVGDARLVGWAFGLYAIVVAICVPLWTFAARRYGKREVWIAGIVPTVLGLLLWKAADGHGLLALHAALAVMSIGTAAYVVSFWSMLPDTVEYGQWKTGIRSESFAFGLVMLGQKAALGLAAGALGMLLAQAGYTGSGAQSAQTLEAIKNMMFWIPLGGALVTGALVFFYPISPRAHRQMLHDIQQRSSGATTT